MGAALTYRSEANTKNTKGRYTLSEANTDIDEEQGQNDYLKYAVAEMQGWRHDQEDAYIANVEFWSDQALFAVFDGHGGREVAVYCNQHYEQILHSSASVQEEKGELEWLRTSFLKVDELLIHPDGQDSLATLRRQRPPVKAPLMDMLNESEAKKPVSEQSNAEMNLGQIGCTANVVLIDKKKEIVYVANSGDSRCVAGQMGKAMEMSIDHKTDDPIEMKRIFKAGSEIRDGRVDGGLNLTRALGDLNYKKRDDLTPEEQSVTANPDTYEFPITNEMDFIIMGCDGIWETKSNEEMVQFIYEQIFIQKANNMEIDCQKIMNQLLNQTVAPNLDEGEGDGMDNMTAILIVFDKDQFQPPRTKFGSFKNMVRRLSKKFSTGTDKSFEAEDFETE